VVVASVVVASVDANAPVPVGAQAGLAGFVEELTEFARRAKRSLGPVEDAPEIVSGAAGPSHVWPGSETLRINPRGDMMNCSACAQALDLTLDGTPASARPFVLDSQRLTRDQHIANLVQDPDRVVEIVSLWRKEVETVVANAKGTDATEEFYAEARALLAEFDALKEDPSLLPAAVDEIIDEMIGAAVMWDATDRGIAQSVGRELRDWRTFKSMENAIRKIDASWPDRAKGIFSIRSKDGGIGHVFNVVKYKGRVFLLDGQIGEGHTFATWRDIDVRILRTRDIPPEVDIEGFRFPPPVDEPVTTNPLLRDGGGSSSTPPNGLQLRPSFLQ
ncbi:MAG: hypothetical protein KC417_06280, partial [Myxococcales bacterium]|nr:hypothetical protein [Myxococcales bacterium]